jgi:hypothetical protein
MRSYLTISLTSQPAYIPGFQRVPQALLAFWGSDRMHGRGAVSRHCKSAAASVAAGPRGWYCEAFSRWTGKHGARLDRVVSIRQASKVYDLFRHQPKRGARRVTAPPAFFDWGWEVRSPRCVARGREMPVWEAVDIHSPDREHSQAPEEGLRACNSNTTTSAGLESGACGARMSMRQHRRDVSWVSV